LVVDFGSAAASPATFAGGTLTTAAGSGYDLDVGQSQLFQFVLSAQSAAAVPGEAVRMTITDALGNVLFTLSGPVGDTVSGASLFLTPGAYHVSFTVEGVADALPAPVTFVLRGLSLSDPVGPAITDPTTAPQYTVPGNPSLFSYPGSSVTSSPYYWFLVF